MSSRFLVALNLGATAQLSRDAPRNIEVSTHLDRVREFVSGDLQLRPDEGVVAWLFVD
jgi:hypothetical protein